MATGGPFDGIRAVSFDCYGTLIDWETGILRTIEVVLAAHGVPLAPPQVLEDYAGFEAALESDAYRPYRDILRCVMHGFGVKYGFVPTDDETNALGGSLQHWKPFGDAEPSLACLKRQYRLAVLSNVDRDLFIPASRLLRVPLDVVVTAEDVGSYKPSRKNFETLLSRLGIPAREVLHVAQSIYHDIAPATELGFRTVRVNRPSVRSGLGATPAAEANGMLEVPDLSTLIRLMRDAGVLHRTPDSHRLA